MTSENPYKKYEALFEGWPTVESWKLRDEHSMYVAGRHKTPYKVKRADSLGFKAVIFWGVLLVLLFYAAYNSAYPTIKHHVRHDEKLWAGIGVCVWLILNRLTRSALDKRAMKDTIVDISPSFIQINKKVYDARVQHKFTMDVHRLAKEEADEELREQQRGPAYATTRHTKYYRRGFQIYFEYLGQRILVTDIFDEETAEQFLRALVAVDKIIHKEKTVFAANANAEESAAAAAETRQADYFGTRPALD